MISTRLSKKEKETLWGVAGIAVVIFAIAEWPYAAALLAAAALIGALWCLRTGRKEPAGRRNLYLIGGGLVLLALVFAGVSADGFSARRAAAAAEAQKAAETAAAENAAHQADLDRIAAEAKAMGLSVADYRKAQSVLIDARTDCANYLAARAKYDVKLSDTSQAGWGSNGTVIILQGHDVLLQNGFGAWTHPEYRCIWNIAERKVLDFKIKNRD